MSIVASQTVATIGAPLALTMISGTVGAGTGTIVPTPDSGAQLVIIDGVFQLEAGGDVSMTLNAGTVPFRRYLAGTVGDALELATHPGAEYRLGADMPLTLVASAGTIGYSVRYLTE